MSRKLLFLALLAVLPAALPGVSLTQSAFCADRSPSAAFRNNGIVEESVEMMEYLHRGDAFLSKGDWERAIRHYQRALEAVLFDAPNAMLPLGGPVDNEVRYFAPAMDACLKRLMKMDAAALKIYRALFERRAAKLLEAALEGMDPVGLRAVGDRFPFTESGFRALVAAGDVSLERGDFGDARLHYSFALDMRRPWPPSSSEERVWLGVLAAKAAFVYSKTGSRERLLGLRPLMEGSDGVGGVEIAFGGVKTTVAEFVEGRVKSFKPPEAADVRDYPTFGGNDARNFVIDERSGRPPGVKWHYVMEEKFRNLKTHYKTTSPQMRPFLLPFIPAVAEGTVFLNTGSTLLGLDELNGERRFAFHRPAGDGGRSSSFYPDVSFCTYYRGVVYMATAAGKGASYNIQMKGALFAVDAGTGRELWNGGEATGLTEYDRILGPIVARGSEVLFVVANRRLISDHCFLVCADAKSGALKWRCYLGERRGAAPRQRSARVVDSIVMDGDTAIVFSSAGIVSAVDSRSGRVVWTTMYNQDVAEYLRTFGYLGANYVDHRSWCFGHPILYKGRVIFAPKDSSRIFCLDAKTGRLEWAVHKPGLMYMVGVDDATDNLYFIEDELYKALSRREAREKEAPSRVRLKALNVMSSKLTYSCDSSMFRAVGRPAMTSSAIYISTERNLLRFDRKTGKVERLFRWLERDLRPGNIVVVKNAIYVANSEGVYALYGPGVMEDLNEMIRANPADSAALFRRGRVLASMGRSRDALRDYETALKAVKPEQRLAGGSLEKLIRSGLFDSYMALTRRSLESGNFQEGFKFAAQARKSAVSEGQIVDVSAVLGALYEVGEDEESWRKAVDCFQKVVAADCDKMLDFSRNTRISSRFYAAQRIGALVSAHGRGLYTGHEAQAAKRLAAIGDSPKEPRKEYEALYRDYPNSIAALKAMHRVAARYEKQGNTSMALIVLKDLAGKFEDVEEMIPVLLDLQRLSGEARNFTCARGALMRLEKTPPGIEMDLAGGRQPVCAYAKAALAALEAREAAADGVGVVSEDIKLLHKVELKRTRLPGTDKRKNRYPDDENLPERVRVMGVQPPAMRGKILVKTAGVLECVDTEAGKVEWSNSGENVWIGVRFFESTNMAIVIPGHAAAKAGIVRHDRVLSINGKPIKTYADILREFDKISPGENIRLEYSRDGKPSKTAELETTTMPPSLTGRISRAWYAAGNMLVLKMNHISSDRRGVIIWLRGVDIATGKTLWRRRLPNVAFLEGARAVNNVLAYALAGKENTAVRIIDLSTGDNLLEHTIKDASSSKVIIAGDCFIVNRFKDRMCEVYDIRTGEMRFQIKLGEDAPRNAYVAGERLLAVTDYKKQVYVFDLRSGRPLSDRVIFNNSQIYANERFLAMVSRGKVRIIDSLNPAIRDRLDVGSASRMKPVMGRNRIFFVKSSRIARGNPIFKNSVIACDMRTNKIAWSKSVQFNKWAQFRTVAGGYLVLDAHGIRRDRNAAPEGGYAYMYISVIDSVTGAEIINRDYRRLCRRSEFGCWLAGGRMCVLMGRHILILGMQNQQPAPAGR